MNTTPTMPSAEEEIWRYSRIGELDLPQFAPGTARTEFVGIGGTETTYR